MKKLNLFFLIGFCGYALFAQPVKKVLIVGIDGCRQDALALANTPNIDQLIANGLFSPDALTLDVTKSGPGWSAMLTGVWSDKHLVSNNDFSTNNYADYPPIFHYIEQYDPNLNTASVVAWYKINKYIVTSHADYITSLSSDSAVASKAGYLLSQFDPDFMFVHFDETDITGHISGFSPANQDYIQKIENADSYIGALMDSLQARMSYESEDWLIMVSTDHGGTGTSHGGTSIEERNIFVIVSGENIPASIITKDTVGLPPGQSFDYSGTPRTVDIPLTALKHLCIPIDTSWELAGNSLIADCQDLCSKPFNAINDILGNGSVQLSWTPIPGAVSYLLRGKIIGASANVHINTSNTFLNLASLTPGATYEWQVAAICPGDTSIYSVLKSFTMPWPCVAPPVIYSNNPGPTSIVLNWQTILGATGYIISGRRTGNPHITNIHINGDTTHSIFISGLTPEIDYEWSIRTLCSGGDTSDYALADYFSTPAMVFKNPLTEEKAFKTGKNWLKLFPNPVKNELGVVWKAGESPGHKWIRIISTSGEIILQRFFEQTGDTQNFKINTAALPAGLYHFECYQNNIRTSKKFIVAR